MVLAALRTIVTIPRGRSHAARLQMKTHVSNQAVVGLQDRLHQGQHQRLRQHRHRRQHQRHRLVSAHVMLPITATTLRGQCHARVRQIRRRVNSPVDVGPMVHTRHRHLHRRQLQHHQHRLLPQVPSQSLVVSWEHTSQIGRSITRNRTRIRQPMSRRLRVELIKFISVLRTSALQLERRQCLTGHQNLMVRALIPPSSS